MVSAEALTLHHSQVFHGLLNFAGGFYSGRGIRHLGSERLDLRRLSAAHAFTLGSSGLWLQKQKKCCTEFRLANFGRTLPICIWSDGSWEDGQSGIGAVVYDCLTHKGRVFAGSVPDSIIKLWIDEMGSPTDPGSHLPD